MKIYLAAKYSRNSEMRQVRDVLKSNKHIVISRWIEGQHEMREGQDDYPQNKRFAREDLEDMVNSECLLWFSSPTNDGRGGRHVEFGYAIAIGLEIHVIGRKENVFHYLDGITHHETLDDFLDSVV